MEKLHNEMRELTLAAGVKEEVYDDFKIIDPAITEEELARKWVWINEIHQTLYFKVLEIWRRLPADVWKRYHEFGESSLREQKILKENRRRLKLAWNAYHKETRVENHKKEDPVNPPGV